VRLQNVTMDGDGNAAVLLKHILVAIDLVFPDADLAVEPDEASNNIVFSIGDDRRVVVTEAFLDAEEGVASAVYTLGGLRLHLGQLEPGNVLMVTHKGLLMIQKDSIAR
jgi:hypothetical protein